MRSFSERILKPYLYLFPALILIIVFQIIPIFYAFYLSFFNWDMITPKIFVGLKNYYNLLLEPDFWKSVWVTFYYVIIAVPVGIGLAIVIAVFLNSKIKMVGFFRTSFFIPYVVSITAIALVWLWIYNSNDYGLLNYILGFFGVKPIKWLEDPKWAMPAVIFMLIWKNLGFNVIIFLTRLQSIDNTYYEAAEIDGASKFQQFLYVTLPLLKPTTMFLVTVSTIYAFRIFPSIYVLTPEGGPNGSTTTVVFYLYKMAYEEFRLGYAAAVAYVLFFIILFVTVVQRKLLKSAESIE